MHLSPSTGPEGDLNPAHIPHMIPLFPLPNVVFFPRTYLPLHIFEPRYRDMVRDAAKGHRMIGMVLLKEGWETNYEGAPEVYALGCAGRIVAMQALSDGRSNILLQGLRRFEILEEVGAERYRQGRIAPRDPANRETDLPSEVRKELLKAVTALLRDKGEDPELSALLSQPLHDDALVQNLSFGLEFSPLEKQFLLESDSLIQQARRLLDLLQFKLHERPDQSGQTGPVEWT
jgi:Lon protease-like protein